MLTKVCVVLVPCCALLMAMTGPTLAQPAGANLPADHLPPELSLTAIPQGLDTNRPIPADNRLTQERVQLGRRLFFDGRLSKDGTISCASCHIPERAFASNDVVAIGVAGKRGRRNSPTLLNRVYGRTFFWDGRAGSLEEQALQPIENPLEMDTSLELVLGRLRHDKNYRVQFALAYESGITKQNLARALASFQRVLLSGNSAVDRFHGGEFPALTALERQGLWLFESRGSCWKCHRGPNFTDEAFHNTGVSWGEQPPDLGRFDVTGQPGDRGSFHTPSLRNIALTSPYMHDGSIGTLEDVVAFYNRGGQVNPLLDPIVKPLNLTRTEQAALVAFLRALTGSNQLPNDVAE